MQFSMISALALAAGFAAATPSNTATTLQTSTTSAHGPTYTSIDCNPDPNQEKGYSSVEECEANCTNDAPNARGTQCMNVAVPGEKANVVCLQCNNVVLPYPSDA